MRPVRLLHYTLLFFALAFLFAPGMQAQTPIGTKFLVTLPAIVTRAERINNDTSFIFSIEIQCSRETKVSVQWPNTLAYMLQDAVVQPGGRIIITKPMITITQLAQSAEYYNSDSINMRALLVTADQPVSVHVTFDKNFRTESYTAVPFNAYDTTYTIVNYPGVDRSGFVVTAIEDGTNVTISPTVNTDGYHIKGVPYTLSLNKYQVLQVMASEHRSPIGELNNVVGMKVRSNKPIGILDSTSYEVPEAYRSATAKGTMDPQLSDNMAGRTFYTAPFAPQESTLVRFVATQPGTTLFVNGTKFNSSIQDSIFTFWIYGLTKIEASKPVVGMHWAFGLVSLTPVEHYTRAVQWISPLLDPRPSSPPSFWGHYVMITAPIEARNSVRLDGKPVDLPMTSQDGKYVSGIIGVTPNGHVIESDSALSAIAYGVTANDSYAMTTSEALRSVGKLSIDTLRFTSCSSAFDTTFIVSNLGNNVFRIDSAIFSGVQGKVLVPASFPQAYIPGANNSFAVSFTLPQIGTYSGTLRLYSDANNRAVFEIPIIATHDSAQLAVPSVIDFGVLGSSETQRDTVIALHNSGTRPVIVTAADFKGTGFTVLRPTLPDTIAAGATDSLVIHFVAGNGLREATLKLSGTPCLTAIDVKVRGFKGSGASLLVQRHIEYPAFVCTAPAFVDSVLAIRSIGDAPVRILSAGISGANKSDYALLDDPVAKSPIVPGDTMFVRVRFTPGGFGVRLASLDLVTNAANADTIHIALRASKDTAFVVPTVTEIDFGQVRSCDGARDTVITLTNNGTVPDTITAIDLGGSTAYTVTPALPIVVYQGTPQELRLRFAPTSDGTFPVTLKASDGPCGGGMQLRLKGERVAPSLSASQTDVRFDTMYACTQQAVTQKIVLTNNGALTDTIGRGSFAGNAGFTTATTFPIVLLPGASDTLEVTFTPSGAGSYVGVLALDWGPCDGRETINLSGEVLDVTTSLSAVGVDFGQVDINASARRTITLHNNGTVARTITGVDVGTSGTLRVVQPATLPVTIAPGDSLVIELEYAPTKRGRLDTSATITVAAPCGEQQQFTLKGEAIGEEIITGALTLAVPAHTVGKIDDTVSIPISISASSNLTAVAPSAMRLVVRYDYTMLAPLKVTTEIPGMIAEIVQKLINGNEREVEIELIGGGFPAQGEIAKLEGYVLLGDAMTTPVAIDSVRLTLPQNRVVTITTTGGEFDVSGVCLTGGNRLVRLGTSTKLKPSHPNPFRVGTTIEYETGVSGRVEMVVLDGTGRVVRTLVSEEVTAGSHTVYFDGSTLASGLYICELRSNGERLRISLLLVQ